MHACVVVRQQRLAQARVAEAGTVGGRGRWHPGGGVGTEREGKVEEREEEGARVWVWELGFGYESNRRGWLHESQTLECGGRKKNFRKIYRIGAKSKVLGFGLNGRSRNFTHFGKGRHKIKPAKKFGPN